MLRSKAARILWMLRQKTPGSETQDFITHGIAGGMSFRFALVPSDSKVP